jgi:plastocyanin
MRLAALLMLVSTPALAAGSITGTVHADKIPASGVPAVKIAKDASVCGKESAREALQVGPGDGLANVVVALQGVKPAQPPAPVVGAAVDQVGCRYTPHVQAVTVGTALTVLNNDAVLHNVHGTVETGASPLTVFNVAMPFKGGKAPQVLKRPGAIKLRCDAGHTWMNAYVHVFDHPWYAVTDGKGRFTIRDVPAGKYTIEFWHEPLVDGAKPWVRTATVEVSDGKAATADLKWSADLIGN